MSFSTGSGGSGTANVSSRSADSPGAWRAVRSDGNGAGCASAAAAPGQRQGGVFDTLIYERSGPIAWVTLNRPEVLNAFSVRMRDELFAALEAVRDDPDVRALVLRGAGRAFCAGADLTEFGPAPSPVAARSIRFARDVWALLDSVEVPKIAALHGFVIGSGLEIALFCDLRVVADGTQFAFPETHLGLIPAAGKGTRLNLPYPKELYPVIRENRYKPLAQFVVENLVASQAREIVFVINETKHQLIGYFGSGQRFGCRFSYVVQEGNGDRNGSTSPGLAHALDSAYHLVCGKTVLFGMADTLMQPQDIFRQLLLAAHPDRKSVV